ncbi:MAG: chemotaxis response regulator protein-glutamate methylesterase [Planctomycetes bacterium]|nr:chemotaxis response regulator protein-glutamate methylesterase [Planctomycetota bacterium]MBI3843005.1 chemotaxis response regulator protein-glutamate methylesterase [Planctomycetota bacterium]
MARVRVFVVDDSITIRKLITNFLSSDPDLLVVGTAANGRIALEKLPQLSPDIVILDVEMPEMNGLETLVEIRKTHPRLPVIMFSALTRRGTAETVEALTFGASDYATKPSNDAGDAHVAAAVRDGLIRKIKGLCASILPRSPGVSSRALPIDPFPSPTSAPPQSSRRRIDVVAIGVSTGGPNALASVLPSIPNDFPVPVVIVQHMPALFTKLLADRLSTRCAMPVREGVSGELLLPGTMWIAPGDFHMVLERTGPDPTLMLNQDPPENSCRPAVDVLFRSVSRVFGAGALGVVMTGMGQDGLRGCEDIHAAGGRVLAQDEATSTVWGMPGAVARAGLAEELVALDAIGREIIRLVTETRHLPRATVPPADRRWLNRTETEPA